MMQTGLLCLAAIAQSADAAMCSRDSDCGANAICRPRVSGVEDCTTEKYCVDKVAEGGLCAASELFSCFYPVCQEGLECVVDDGIQDVMFCRAMRECTADTDCRGNEYCTTRVDEATGNCTGESYCTRAYGNGMPCGGPGPECLKRRCEVGLVCQGETETTKGECVEKVPLPPAPAQGAAEVWVGVSHTSDGRQEECRLTIHHNDMGDVTLMKVKGWGTAWGFDQGDSVGQKEIVVTSDNNSPELREVVTFKPQLSVAHFGFTRIAYEEQFPKWTWDVSRFLGSGIRQRKYISVKGKYDKLVARDNIYLAIRTVEVGRVEIDCENLERLE